MITNRDNVQINIKRDLDELNRIMLPMSLNANDRRLLLQLFASMALNKETVYSETLKVKNKLHEIDKVMED